MTGYRIFKTTAGPHGPGWGGEVEERRLDSHGRQFAWTAAELSRFFEQHARRDWAYRVVTVIAQ